MSDTYKAAHYCKGEAIRYDHPLPTLSDHRPLWPMYGEYK